MIFLIKNKNEKRMWLRLSFFFKYIIFIQISVIILYYIISLFSKFPTYYEKNSNFEKKLNFWYEFYG